jgi:phosphoribosylformylglycinamidine synthase subunit PurQ / glutaminase
LARPRVLVLRAAGVNCNEETAYAFELAGAQTEQVHVNELLARPEILRGYGAVACPGGFSYGDDITAGKILAVEIGHALGDAFREHVARGGLLLGVCNGFQVLIKTGLLPGAEAGLPAVQATLAENQSNRYEDRWVRLAINPRRSVFFADDTPIELPVAHGEGRVMTATPADLERLEATDRVVLRYVGRDGGDATFPDNPNGSTAGIAGICDMTGQVLGLMPHPERFIRARQHPRHFRERTRIVGDGLRIFENAVKHLR